MSKLDRIDNKRIFVILIIILLISSLINNSTIADEDYPDLVIDSVDLPKEFIEGEDLEIIIKIKNQGGKNVSAGIKIGVALKIDGAIVNTNATLNGLLPGSSVFINISWTPAYGDIGEHFLTIEVDYEQIIYEGEEGENNNFQDSYIEVLEKFTLLKITNIDLPDSYSVNKTATILVTVKNNGENTTRPIYVKLNSSEDGEVETVIKYNNLPRGESYVFSFNWTPTYFGSQTLIVKVIHDGKIHHDLEEPVFVNVTRLQWWNISWHYRCFMIVEGSGVISRIFNFSF